MSEKKKIYGWIELSGDAGYERIARIAQESDERGADGLVFFEHPENDTAHDDAIRALRQVKKQAEIPFLAGGVIHRLEDVKKYLYAGASRVFFDKKDPVQKSVYYEAAQRFGEDRCCWLEKGRIEAEKGKSLSLSACFEDGSVEDFYEEWKAGEGGIVLPPSANVPDYYALKQEAFSRGIPVYRFESSLSFQDFKTGEGGLIPVIVQDYRTDEVLMMAYMNEEAFTLTCRTGRMTYFSRSRQSLWVKGETSGHFQFVKELRVDCDNDTLLAKVKQIGAACHTGNRSCFYRVLAERETGEIPATLKVLEDVYQVIADRKEHPREGSYTNYLFEKGLDKILKKCGEEATEIVIAAKNPDAEELRYEMCDFLYHMMVLMVDRGLTWPDLMKELANRE